MPSLNLDLNYFEHLKAMRLEAKLGNGADVLPIRLWAYVGKLNPEGGRVGMLAAELERICRWWGEKGQMVSAMIEIGFLERHGEFFQIHDWFDHSGHLAAFKKRAVKANRIRWKNHRKSRTPTRTPKADVRESSSSAVHSSAMQDIAVQSISETSLAAMPQIEPKPKKVFIPPTIEEVAAYAKEKGIQIDAERFVDHYGASGWYRGKTKITNWKLCVNTWKNGGSYGTGKNNPVRNISGDPERAKAYAD